jgi:hypothetical protein
MAKLTPPQWDIICYAEQYWRENGFFPSFGEIATETGINPKEVEELVFDSLTKKHLEARGINWNQDRPTSESSSNASEKRNGRAKRLSDIQLAVVSTILNPADKRSVTAKLESLGVAPGTYAGWKKSKIFSDYMTSQGKALFDEFMPDMENALVSRAASGDVRAIKYAFEVNGRYRPQQGDELINVKFLIMQLIEVIQKHVKDPEVLRAIAYEIDGIQKGVNNNGDNPEIRAISAGGG